MPALKSLLLIGLPMALAASPAVMRRGPTSNFSLYAYGDGIGGAQVFTTGDGAFVGSASSSNSTEAAPVLFDVGTDNALLGSPNATETTPSWSNLTFNVPDTTSSGHQVSFSNSTTNSTTGRSASGFVFYGQYLFHQNTGGNLQSMWYALPSDQDGVWTLNWNSTGDDTDGQVIVTLRAVAPSTDASSDTTS
ncbi:uncharacterized protein GGS22DRAFT_88557 [Annulohypoxylon maeteangense]|uniref:uncharacterized protein n=1 Tax=Annulohypoxylon maeteangense TaxID=1927788 RepID=UPI0020080975|nr:uncharacterized protein GGS22DRAFT_88557 [Annulohypoxylon maeteangense]KAI0887736.1 hypothetical protein GGS22DRAFT_88557 [Annulohypoxylon maeteangense]